LRAQIKGSGAVGEWYQAGVVSATHRTLTKYDKLFKGECRVRATNVGSLVPSAWSDVLAVLSEKEEKAAAVARPKSAAAQQASRPLAAARGAEGVAEAGAAVIDDDDRALHPSHTHHPSAL
jgi:hypothetical protein